MEPANSEWQVLLPQIARGAGKVRHMLGGLRSAGVKMTPLGSKDVPPTLARNWGGQAWVLIISRVRLCLSKAFILLSCRKMKLSSDAFLKSAKSADFNNHTYSFKDKQVLW